MLRLPLAIAVAWLAAAGGASQVAAGGTSPSAPEPLFASDEVVELTLAGPLSSTFADTKNRDERPFTLRVGSDQIPLQVRVRGHSRARVCRNAPLRLGLDTAMTANTLFAGQDKLKLVLPCRDSDSAEADILKEYAAYRIFNLLSSVSFRVRLARIRFMDTEHSAAEPMMERYGFLIEPDEALGVRAGLQEARVEHVRRGGLDADQAALTFIFQYLIANTDWSLVAGTGEENCCHNIRLFGTTPVLYVVPYDFDLSGLVDAPYARPDPSLHISRVTQRLYRGYCIDPEALGPALDRVTARRGEILDVLRALPLLSEKQVESRVAYLDRFFEEAADRAKLLDRFRSRCI